MFTVEFKDSHLALIETDEAHKTGLPVAVIKSCRSKLNFIRAAKDERDLRAWKSLNYKELEGNKEGIKQIRLNDQWRMLLIVNSDCKPPKATILAVEDPH